MAEWSDSRVITGFVCIFRFAAGEKNDQRDKGDSKTSWHAKKQQEVAVLGHSAIAALKKAKT